MSADKLEGEAAATPLERAQRPDLGHASIPKERYIARTYMEAEQADLWTRVWHLAGFESDLPLPGSYFTYEVATLYVSIDRYVKTPYIISYKGTFNDLLSFIATKGFAPSGL